MQEVEKTSDLRKKLKSYTTKYLDLFEQILPVRAVRIGGPAGI